jgi:hypothetical protein
LQEYLALRRGLGFKMHDAGLALPQFVAFMEEKHALHVTTGLALATHGPAVGYVTPNSGGRTLVEPNQIKRPGP